MSELATPPKVNSVKALAFLKKLAEEWKELISFGSPQIPEETKEFLAANPEVALDIVGSLDSEAGLQWMRQERFIVQKVVQEIINAGVTHIPKWIRQSTNDKMYEKAKEGDHQSYITVTERLFPNRDPNDMGHILARIRHKDEEAARPHIINAGISYENAPTDFRILYLHSVHATDHEEGKKLRSVLSPTALEYIVPQIIKDDTNMAAEYINDAAATPELKEQIIACTEKAIAALQDTPLTLNAFLTFLKGNKVVADLVQAASKTLPAPSGRSRTLEDLIEKFER